MSSPHLRTSSAPARHAATCLCAFGGGCSSFAPGHALHLIQARLASATPTEWVDGIVERRQPAEGSLVVRTLSGEPIELWNGSGAAAAVEIGAPIAVHARYDVLRVGARSFNVLRG